MHQCLFQPMLLCLKEDAPILNWPSSKLGCRGGSFEDEAWFLACLRLIWAKPPKDSQKKSLRSFAGNLVLHLYERFLTSRTWIACGFRAVCFGNFTSFHRQANAIETPSRGLCTGGAPLLRSQRLGTSQTRERWAKTVLCRFAACSLKTSSQCSP